MQLIKNIAFISLCSFFVINSYAQISKDVAMVKNGKIAIGHFIYTSSTFAPFPDTARTKGHDYDGKHFDFKDHYNDSSVMIYVPQKFNLNKTLELFVWFHGWNNNIDSANSFYQLTDQFELSGRNAIFIFPEGPKNAPDSYGGKLERPEMFALFINDLLKKLEDLKYLPKKKQLSINDCSISLAGHSGAYRVISKIIQYNKIDELILFDAMYGGNEAFLQWISENNNHRFIHIYTKDGGTFDNTHLIMQQLKDSLKVNFNMLNENEVNGRILKSANRFFIYSDKEHNEVINNNFNLERFLKFRKP